MSRSISLAVAAGLAVLLVLAPTAAASPPTITYTIDGIAGANGWYRGSSNGNNVVLHWFVSGASETNCVVVLTIPGPTTGTTRECWARNSEGTVTRITQPPIKIDADPPTAVAARMSRAPDFRGWYNHPVGVAWSGRDATSGVAGCTSVTYAGPDGAGAVVRGGCADKAGNSSSTVVAINYDATAPVLANLSVTSAAAADLVRWSSSSPADRIVVRRGARGNKRQRVVYSGSAASFVDKKIRPGLEYVYYVRAYDQAGNASPEVSVAGLPKVLTLRKLRYVPRAAPSPILKWKRGKRAAYYHVQLFRGSKRVLAAWPTKHKLGLPAAWRWAGHRYRLRPGHYRWYVWAGLGPRSFAQYRAIGSAQFIVPKKG